jgi:RHS repeat-associated protein
MANHNYRIYHLHSGNFDTLKPVLINNGYDPDLVDDGDPATMTDFKSRVDNGYTFILPEYDNVGLGDWNGTGFIGKQFTNTSMSIQMAISGGYLGGYVTCQNCFVNSNKVKTQVKKALNTNSKPSKSKRQSNNLNIKSASDPVEMAGGAFHHENTDLALGGGAPMGLAFTRLYNSSMNQEKSILGYGWTHNYDIYLTKNSHGDPGLGMRQPVDAAPLIAVLYASLDLMKTDDTDTLLKWVESALISKWAVDQLTGEWINDELIRNAVTVHMGNKLMEFIKLPDDTYSPPPGITSELIDNGDGTFSLRERFGTQLDFDTDDRISQLTDIDGNTLTFNYDTNGLKTVQDTFGRTITLRYMHGEFYSVSDSTGRSVIYYLSGDDLTGYSDAERNFWSFAYDDVNNPHKMTSLTNPLGITTATNTYDSLGRVMEQTVPRQTNSVTYNFYFSGFRNVEEDPDRNQTVYYFDKKGRPIGEENKLGHKSSKDYDGQFHVVKVTDPLLNETIFEYDGNQNLISTTNALLQSTDFKYDSDFDFRLTDTIDPLYHGSHIEYDSEHHPELSQFGIQYNASLLPMDSGVFQSGASYFENGLIETTTDGRGTIAMLTYDGNGSPLTSKVAAHPAVDFSYDSIGRLSSLTDQVGSTTNFAYDNRGLITSRTDPLGNITNYYYDDAGRLDHVIDRNGDTVSFAYTPTSKLETITYPDTAPDPSVSFTYNQHDDLTEMQDSLGTSSYNYDAAHRLISQTDVNGFTVSYNYNEAGNLTSLTYPGNKTVMYTYDGLNRLKTVTNWLSQTATYTYDNAGRLISLTNFNGTATDYSYDNANRLTDLENKHSDSSSIADYHFTLDENGNRTQVIKNEPIMPVLSLSTSTYIYNPERNRLENANGEILTYDDEGQIYTRGINTTYDFDHEHRLISVQQSGSSDEYFYDGVGNRLMSDRNGEITRYIYDAGGNLLAEADNNNNILRYYIRGLGLMAMVESGQVYTYHFNAVGSTVAMTDSGQNIVNMYAYTPFGVIANENEQIPQPFKFVGQYGVMSEGNGLYYMRARYYDPDIGRFISEDPIGFGGGDVNLYAYVGNNPVIYIDPNGLLTWKERIFVTGIGIWRFIGPAKLYVEGLGWVKPLPGIGTFLGILFSPSDLSDPYLGADGKWYWPDGNPVDANTSDNSNISTRSNTSDNSNTSNNSDASIKSNVASHNHQISNK